MEEATQRCSKFSGVVAEATAFFHFRRCSQEAHLSTLFGRIVGPGVIIVAQRSSVPQYTCKAHEPLGAQHLEPLDNDCL